MQFTIVRKRSKNVKIKQKREEDSIGIREFSTNESDDWK